MDSKTLSISIKGTGKIFFPSFFLIRAVGKGKDIPKSGISNLDILRGLEKSGKHFKVNYRTNGLFKNLMERETLESAVVTDIKIHPDILPVNCKNVETMCKDASVIYSDWDLDFYITLPENSSINIAILYDLLKFMGVSIGLHPCIMPFDFDNSEIILARLSTDCPEKNQTHISQGYGKFKIVKLVDSASGENLKLD